MFDLMGANTVRTRMRELRKFIEMWYGPHKKSYECKEVPPELPLPLKLFYRHNAFRPCRNTQYKNFDYFYEGGGGHHLFAPKNLGLRSKTKVRFFMEYQGDFDAYSLKSHDDPPVWLNGHLSCHGSYGHPTTKTEGRLQETLSRFLVTHVLLTSLYESENCTLSASAANAPLVYSDFEQLRSESRLIWDAGDWHFPHCPHYLGKVFLFRENLLVHQYHLCTMLGTNEMEHQRSFHAA